MKGNRRGVSLGTILTLALTAAVILGCAFLLLRIQGGTPGAPMSAQRAFDLVGGALQGGTPEPEPQATVRTVTVTLAPVPIAPLATPAPATAAPVKEVSDVACTFTVTVGGLMGFESEISDSVYDKAAKRFDFSQLFSLLRSKVDGDLTLAMLPQVINAADQKYGDHLAPQAAASGIWGAGFDYVLLNSSHALDQGIDGVNQTVSVLTQQGFTCLGVTSGSATQHRMIQLNGAHIALLAYTDSLTAKGRIARDSQPQVADLFDLRTAARDIAAMRAQGADFVAVALNWAKSDTTGVTTAMKQTAYGLAEAGADLILGYHPKRVLPMETISVPDENGVQRQCLICYSMGTLLTESREPYDISGMLLNLRVTCKGGQVHFESIQYTPTYIWRRSVKGKMQYRVLCSADPAPEGMDAKQKEIMARALKRVGNILKDGPAYQREQ